MDYRYRMAKVDNRHIYFLRKRRRSYVAHLRIFLSDAEYRLQHTDIQDSFAY